jgi:hypothetical protein
MRSRDAVPLPRLATIGGLVLVASAAFAAPKRPDAISPEKCFAAFREHRLGGHEWRAYPEVLRVRDVRGRVMNDVGGWPDGTRVVFQAFGPATRPLVRTAMAAPDGAFLLEGLPAGEYCFEASAEGWDPIEGLLYVSSRHPKAARIELSLPLAQ